VQESKSSNFSLLLNLSAAVPECVYFFGNLKEKTLAAVQNGGIIREVLEGM